MRTVVFATAARQLGIAKLVSPGVGVREAVLLELAETAREEQARAEGAHDKALLTAARSFANRVDHDTTHGEHVRLLARQLFHQLRDVHGVGNAACFGRHGAVHLHAELGRLHALHLRRPRRYVYGAGSRHLQRAGD